MDFKEKWTILIRAIIVESGLMGRGVYGESNFMQIKIGLKALGLRIKKLEGKKLNFANGDYYDD